MRLCFCLKIIYRLPLSRKNIYRRVPAMSISVAKYVSDKLYENQQVRSRGANAC